MKFLIRLLLPSLFALSLSVTPQAQDRPPHVVLIMADDMGCECLGTFGSTSYQTPNLDRMAAKGVRFDHCYSTPLCTPSRNQIMTGRYNCFNYLEFGYLDPKESTFGHMMQEAGYATMIAGKWQLHGISHSPGKFPGGDNNKRPLEAEDCGGLMAQNVHLLLVS